MLASVVAGKEFKAVVATEELAEVCIQVRHGPNPMYAYTPTTVNRPYMDGLGMQ